MGNGNRSFRHYLSASGRANRAEYWGIGFLSIIFSLVTGGILEASGFSRLIQEGGVDSAEPGAVALQGVVTLVGILIFICQMTLIVRRLHDLGATGWLATLMFFPIGIAVAAGLNGQASDSLLGVVIWLSIFVGVGLLALGIVSGQAGPNKYGNPPA
jgi:uncharacterized membrane protein YhaH (DUF805 family)